MAAPSRKVIFKIGDIVMLKSGGPFMTVTQVGDTEGETFVRCACFINENKHGSFTFPPEALVPT